MPKSSPLNLKLRSLITSLDEIKKSTKVKTLAPEGNLVIAPLSKLKELKAALKGTLAPHQFKRIPESNPQGPLFFETSKGHLAILLTQEENWEEINHEGLLEESAYAYARNHSGASYLYFETQGCSKLHIQYFHCDYDVVLGSLLGLEMASYDYKEENTFLSLSSSFVGDLPKEALKEALSNAQAIGASVNISRFLVDTPPSQKRPSDYAESIKKTFSNKAGMEVHVWDEKRLEKEKMGCLLGVGQGSVQLPRLVHLKYRPNNMRDIAPIAFVGKGITFDTGGLNMKPGGSMRLMKKDMGGSASLVGLAHWLCSVKSDVPCDIYLALAENSVDAHSFRPSDILTARNGKTVEIDNTDAEGRLVMADALCVASEAKGKDRPQFLIDVATLTGAIKVGLGDEIGGLFSDNDDLAFIIQSCSQISGDLLWRMPLMIGQRQKLKSDVATLANSASGFGGAIRAAMFLKEFTGDIPWAHLDIYGWNGARQGAYRASGGSGQGVQCLAQFVSQL